MARITKENWDIVKNEYITTPITQYELANKHKISRQAISNHCKKEKWEVLRVEYVTKSSQNSQTDRIEGKINERQSLINSIENLVKLKLKGETRVQLKSQSIENLKLLASLISKSKNNISELIKVSELLKGNATERTEVSEKEKQERADRILKYRTPSTFTGSSTN